MIWIDKSALSKALTFWILGETVLNALAGDSGFFIDVDLLTSERLDPIVDPNAIASHMHRIVGGSAFGASYNYETYSSASC